MAQFDVVRAVALALEREPQVSLSSRPLRVALDHGDLVLEGEVATVSAKKLALERAAAVPGVDRIIDRLHVATAHHVPDAVLEERALEVMSGESLFQQIRLIPRRLGYQEEPKLHPGERGYLAVSVEDGVVTLDGSVPSLSHKRVAGVLAWWLLGVRDVVNGLGVEPAEPDSDMEITDATRWVLERDPLVHADGVQVWTQGSVVRLTGAVSSEEERREAERDAWCVFGVDRVINELGVQPPSPRAVEASPA